MDFCSFEFEFIPAPAFCDEFRSLSLNVVAGSAFRMANFSSRQRLHDLDLDRLIRK